jgi:hypothetical protein
LTTTSFLCYIYRFHTGKIEKIVIWEVAYARQGGRLQGGAGKAAVAHPLPEGSVRQPPRRAREKPAVTPIRRRSWRVAGSPALQANTRPPTFALFASKPGELPDSYRRYLVNALRQDFDLPGTPIHMILRKGKNPYQPR